MLNNKSPPPNTAKQMLFAKILPSYFCMLVIEPMNVNSLVVYRGESCRSHWLDVSAGDCLAHALPHVVLCSCGHHSVSSGSGKLQDRPDPF